MTVAITNIVAFLGGVILIGGLIWAAKHGNGDREAEDAAREFFTLHGHWPDEESPGPQG
jgi:hypothetical protein